jgi:hypothetical protein
MTGLMTRLTVRALANPAVALDLLALAWAFRRRLWWRLHTAYGEERSVPPVEDVVRFARWRRRILSD